MGHQGLRGEAGKYYPGVQEMGATQLYYYLGGVF